MKSTISQINYTTPTAWLSFIFTFKNQTTSNIFFPILAQSSSIFILSLQFLSHFFVCQEQFLVLIYDNSSFSIISQLSLELKGGLSKKQNMIYIFAVSNQAIRVSKRESFWNFSLISLFHQYPIILWRFIFGFTRFGDLKRKRIGNWNVLLGSQFHGGAKN